MEYDMPPLEPPSPPPRVKREPGVKKEEPGVKKEEPQSPRMPPPPPKPPRMPLKDQEKEKEKFKENRIETKFKGLKKSKIPLRGKKKRRGVEKKEESKEKKTKEIKERERLDYGPMVNEVNRAPSVGYRPTKPRKKRIGGRMSKEDKKNAQFMASASAASVADPIDQGNQTVVPPPMDEEAPEQPLENLLVELEQLVEEEAADRAEEAKEPIDEDGEFRALPSQNIPSDAKVVHESRIPAELDVPPQQADGPIPVGVRPSQPAQPQDSKALGDTKHVNVQRPVPNLDIQMHTAGKRPREVLGDTKEDQLKKQKELSAPYPRFSAPSTSGADFRREVIPVQVMGNFIQNYGTIINTSRSVRKTGQRGIEGLIRRVEGGETPTVVLANLRTLDYQTRARILAGLSSSSAIELQGMRFLSMVEQRLADALRNSSGLQTSEILNALLGSSTPMQEGYREVSFPGNRSTFVTYNEIPVFMRQAFTQVEQNAFTFYRNWVAAVRNPQERLAMMQHISRNQSILFSTNSGIYGGAFGPATFGVLGPALYFAGAAMQPHLNSIAASLQQSAGTSTLTNPTAQQNLGRVGSILPPNQILPNDQSGAVSGSADINPLPVPQGMAPQGAPSPVGGAPSLSTSGVSAPNISQQRLDTQFQPTSQVRQPIGTGAQADRIVDNWIANIGPAPISDEMSGGGGGVWRPIGSSVGLNLTPPRRRQGPSIRYPGEGEPADLPEGALILPEEDVNDLTQALAGERGEGKPFNPEVPPPEEKKPEEKKPEEKKQTYYLSTAEPVYRDSEGHLFVRDHSGHVVSLGTDADRMGRTPLENKSRTFIRYGGLTWMREDWPGLGGLGNQYNYFMPIFQIDESFPDLEGTKFGDRPNVYVPGQWDRIKDSPAIKAQESLIRTFERTRGGDLAKYDYHAVTPTQPHSDTWIPPEEPAGQGSGGGRPPGQHPAQRPAQQPAQPQQPPPQQPPRQQPPRQQPPPQQPPPQQPRRQPGRQQPPPHQPAPQPGRGAGTGGGIIGGLAGAAKGARDFYNSIFNPQRIGQDIKLDEKGNPIELGEGEGEGGGGDGKEEGRDRHFQANACCDPEKEFKKEGLLRPEFYEGGANFVSEVNKDVLVNSINEMQWQSFNNYQWENNQQGDNPFYLGILNEYGARMKAPLFQQKMIPLQNRLSTDIIARVDKAMNPDKFAPRSAKINMKNLFIAISPYEGQAAKGDSLQTFFKDSYETDTEFHDVFLPDWFSIDATDPLERFTEADGTQYPDSERIYDVPYASHDSEVYKDVNQWISDTTG